MTHPTSDNSMESSFKDQTNTSQDCSICQNDIDSTNAQETWILACHHAFHARCIRAAIMFGVDASFEKDLTGARCPLCRGSIFYHQDDEQNDLHFSDRDTSLQLSEQASVDGEINEYYTPSPSVVFPITLTARGINYVLELLHIRRVRDSADELSSIGQVHEIAEPISPISAQDVIEPPPSTPIPVVNTGSPMSEALIQPENDVLTPFLLVHEARHAAFMSLDIGLRNNTNAYSDMESTQHLPSRGFRRSTLKVLKWIRGTFCFSTVRNQ